MNSVIKVGDGDVNLNLTIVVTGDKMRVERVHQAMEKAGLAEFARIQQEALSTDPQSGGCAGCGG